MVQQGLKGEEKQEEGKVVNNLLQLCESYFLVSDTWEMFSHPMFSLLLFSETHSGEGHIQDLMTD